MRFIGVAATAMVVVAMLGSCASDGYYEEPGYVVAAGVAYDPSPYDTNVYVVRGAPPGYYYADNSYWGNHHGHWYRSGGHGGRWSRVDRAPQRVVSVHGHYHR